MDAKRTRQNEIITLPLNGFRLATLGSLSLANSRGETEQALSKRRRKLAVLAVLAVSKEPISRERLAEMFWGDEEESRAKHSLSDALSNLRRVLGPDSITTRQLDIALSPTCPMNVDALELVDAAERREHGRVVDLYRGEFLNGFETGSSVRFDEWVHRVRDQLRRYWLTACAHECIALARARKWSDCALLARRWLDTEPLNCNAALYLLNAIKAPATPAAYRSASAEYELLEQRLESEFYKSPDPEVARLAESIREELSRVAEPAVVASIDPAATPPIGWSRTVSRAAAIPLAGLLFLAATSFTANRTPPRSPTRPSVAVVNVQNAGDSSTAWLETGLPQLIAVDIGRLPGFQVVPEDRVRRAREQLGIDGPSILSRDDDVRLGARAGAAWVVSGSATRGDSLYVLDVTVQDSAGALPPRLFTVTSSSVVALADRAAAEIAALMAISCSTPRC